MIEFLLRNRQAPGDILMISAALRDLHLQYPGQFASDVFTHNRESVWAHNPYVTDLDPGKVRNINLKYSGPIRRSDTAGKHFVTAFHETLGQQLGIPIDITEIRGDIYFTEEERANPLIEGNYWVTVAGGKTDIATKIWGSHRYQEVVNQLRGEIAFVQVGGGAERRRPRHLHSPLDGTVELLGKTSFRQLMRLILHAKGVLCGVTCGMHLAACVNIPCVVIAGGREPPTWERYDQAAWRHEGLEPPVDLVEHTFIETMGELQCCLKKGCWKSHLGGEPRKRNGVDPNCLHLAEGTPKCLAMITPEVVVEAIRAYKTPTSCIEDLKINLVPEKSSPEPPREISNEKTVIEASERKGTMLERTGPPTICVVLYGTYTQLHQRCINSVLKNTQPDKYKLIVGCNEVAQSTLDWLESELSRSGVNHHILVEPTNTYKYPLMRRMFQLVDTDWLVWFDDDSWINNNPDWLQTLAAFFHPGGKSGYHCFGKKYYYHLKNGQIKWVKAAKWYRGKPFRQNKGHDTVDFCTGGFWAASAAVLKALDWPDPRIKHNGGDIMLGAALYQNDVGIQQVIIPGILISDHKRRGYQEVHPGIIS